MKDNIYKIMDIFNKTDNFNYEQMQKEYCRLFTLPIDHFLDNLNSIISSLEINGFGMSLLMQNHIHSILLEVKQILSTLSINKAVTSNKQLIRNDPANLLLHLNTLSQQLNQHSLKSPFYLLLNKANNLILNCTNKILKYYLKINK